MPDVVEVDAEVVVVTALPPPDAAVPPAPDDAILAPPVPPCPDEALDPVAEVDADTEALDIDTWSSSTPETAWQPSADETMTRGIEPGELNAARNMVQRYLRTGRFGKESGRDLLLSACESRSQRRSPPRGS